MAQFLTNKNQQFLNYLKQELTVCDSFAFSVSFIKNAGLELFEKDLINALQRGVIGQIITSTYQNFTDIVSLEKFFSWQTKFPNFSVRVDVAPLGDRGFHSKGYIFGHDDRYTILIGSSNITSFALLRNIEWNARLICKLNDKFAKEVFEEFANLWTLSNKLTRKLIDDYAFNQEYALDQWDMDYFTKFESLEPNFMQKKALKELARIRGLGVSKALVVSATGSGKTYLSAFDARNFGAEKLLFVVHRETILKDALDTFKKVFGNTRKYGYYTGTTRDSSADFLFATNIMLSSSLDKFQPNQFDYIILDECHHATSKTYLKIMDYFQPRFYLGLTATPERMDNQDVFELFDRNVPYELRLREALENDLVVPFKYFGIRDQMIDYAASNKNLLKEMTSPEHCEFLLSHIERHRPNNKLKALVFCRSVEHAEQMADRVRSFGYHTAHLVGYHDVMARRVAFANLQDENNPLELLFSVDLLNEGVDLPAVNMVVFLRPTESSTIFIQQLGRGLRKFEGKEYLTVLDFIGNSYERSVQIAIALGSLSKSSVVEKQLLIDYIRDDFRNLDLPVEIHLDPYSKDEVLNYIEKTNFNRTEFLKQDYLTYKKMLGTKGFVRHIDYLHNEYAPDLLRFIKTNLSGTDSGYFSFLKKVEDSVPDFSMEDLEILKRLSSMLPLVRPYEFEILQCLIEHGKTTKQTLKTLVYDRWPENDKQFEHALDFLTNQLQSNAEKLVMRTIVTVDNNTISLNFPILSSGFKAFLIDLLSYGLQKYLSEFGNQTVGLTLFHNYTTEQFMLITMQRTLRYYKGTKYEDNGTTYILAGLKKDLDEDHHLNYKDKFIDASTFQWESETYCTMTNAVGQKVLNTKVAHLFIRKKKNEDGVLLPYTYIGTGTFTNVRPSTNEKGTLLVDIKLDEPVPLYLHYDFQIK